MYAGKWRMVGSKPWRTTCLQSTSSRSHTRKRGARDKSSLQSRDDLLIVLRLIVELQIVDGRLAGNQHEHQDEAQATQYHPLSSTYSRCRTLSADKNIDHYWL